MQTVTRANDIRTSTRKVRLVADAIRNLSVSEALDVLSVINKRGAKTLEKALKSAVANVVNNSKLEKKDLRIKSIDVNEGTALKRFRPSTRGRIHRYKKRSSNIRIVLEEKASSVQSLENKKPATTEALNKTETQKKGEKSGA
ncbi:MAG: 50S ribosomal protein L22 [Candidatus Levybacteria bacterium]|nr:50S ribosomal protein L22 [Candidatus Levybacteria bacterium]